MDAFDELLREALVVTAAVALPTLVLAAAIGTVVAVIQAATQVQEQTITLLPKVLAVGAVVALFGNFAMRLLASLFEHAVAAIPALVNAP